MNSNMNITDAFARSAAPTLTWRDRAVTSRDLARRAVVGFNASANAVGAENTTAHKNTVQHNSMAAKPAAPPRGVPR